MTEGYPSHDRIKQSWYSFIQGGSAGADVREEVVQSWKRCRDAELSPYLTVTNKVDGEVLQKLLERNAELIATAKPLIDSLYQFLAASGFVVSLCDQDGILLYIVGDDEAISAAHGNMVVGANWSEACVGGNSVGTPLLLDQPVQYRGFEHFCRLPQRWAGSGAPVHAPSGQLLGCLNISGEIEHSHRHTLGMVVITAKAIDMQLKLKEAISYSTQINQHQEATINAMSEGLIILDGDFLISLANQYIIKQLNVSAGALTGHAIGRLCKDSNLLKIIYAHSETTDYITNLEFRGVSYACTITCRTIPQESGKSEVLLLINDILRAKKLAGRLSANQALLTFQDIIGEDMRLRSLISLAMAAAETSANVLILGESGTGKEVFAQSIHTGSPRADGPFIAINCAAIPKELVASTLFGYEEGAFTGAKRGGSPGKFELADRGTLFLDEIGELPLDIQAVLLRVLETKSFTRVGGKDHVTVDVRIIAATNRDLLHESQVKHFRQDLFYRLNVFSLYIPPLRERRADIPLLSSHFLAQMNRRYQRNVTGLSPDALALLMHHDWPGNIRELQNTIERAVVISTDQELDRQVVAQALPMQSAKEATAPPIDHAPNASEPLSGKAAEEEGERVRIRRILEECRWNISKAAVRMGVARSTLYRKIYYYNLKDEE